MGKIINLGRFEMDENFSIVENVDAHEIKSIISKLGPGWRIASFSELKYIANLNFKFNILEVSDV